MPTDEPESDGTLEWDATTIVVVEIAADGQSGLGYTYADAAAGVLIESKLAPLIGDADPMAPAATLERMRAALRNDGTVGLGAMALSAVDIALWDLKAKLLGKPLADVLPRVRETVPVYGSGGFTSYSLNRLGDQLGGWVEQGIPRVKIKVGRDPGADDERVRVAREAIGGAELMVDANGAYDRKQALVWAGRFAEAGCTWLEEPVSSDDLGGLGLVRDQGPAGLEIAAGEYGWDLPYLERMADSVDVLQADVTRCGGVTAMLRLDGVCTPRSLPSSAHCAPSASMHVCCAIESLRHLEWFHDHVRLESMLFDGVVTSEHGELRPRRDRPGLGIELKRADAERYRL